MSDRISSFLGGSPLSVLVRIVVLSIVVGVLLSWLNWTPREIYYAVEDVVMSLWHTVFGSFDRALDYFLLGAAIVVPLFLLSRLMKAGR